MSGGCRSSDVDISLPFQSPIPRLQCSVADPSIPLQVLPPPLNELQQLDRWSKPRQQHQAGCLIGTRSNPPTLVDDQRPCTLDTGTILLAPLSSDTALIRESSLFTNQAQPPVPLLSGVATLQPDLTRR